ncbi:hypothetical protein FRC09_013913 [Ceratobasidium sp. 395]|nr:hypothetical protein FRC09_013913 [Ceratobasidium sp. 395]
MVVPEPGTHRSISAQALSRTEVFQAAQEKGAKIVDGTLTQKKIDEVLASYISRNPALLRIQQEVLHDPHLAIGDLIEERLGYYEADSLKLRVDEQVKKRLAPHTEELRSLELALKDRESKVAELSQTCNQIKQDLNKSQEEAVYLRQQLQQSQNEHTTQLSELQEVCMEEIRLRDVALKGRESKILELSHADKKLKQQLTSGHEEMVGLRQQLQQTQNEYGSLRSQLQLQENIEQSDIVQTLKDLNRDIDDIGRLISEFLVDNYLQKAFSKEPSDVTALDARHITQLKTLLGHVDGKSSLLASSDDIGMPAEDFMDYAIRLSVCRYLYTRIFRPFHPAADATQNEVVAVLYNDIQQREPQAVAAKWRASCFKSIYRPEDPNATTHHVNSITQEFITGSLSSLLTYFLGRSANVWLEPQHQDRLTRLFRVAWDWNSMLKGDVIMLGDFHPTYYDPLRHFDPGLMDEFDSVARRPQPKFILGTLGLGLLSSRAVGGGQTPQVTVVLKATVATKNLYA